MRFITQYGHHQLGKLASYPLESEERSLFSPRTLTLKLFDIYSIEQLKISNVIFYDICHAVPYLLTPCIKKRRTRLVITPLVNSY